MVARSFPTPVELFRLNSAGNLCWMSPVRLVMLHGNGFRRLMMLHGEGVGLGLAMQQCDNVDAVLDGVTLTLTIRYGRVR